jgi:rhamnosyltransferase
MYDTLEDLTIVVAVPVLNAAGRWEAFLGGLKRQTLPIHKVLILDSSSIDGTAGLAEAAGFHVISIARTDFHYGGTRQIAIDMTPNVDIMIYLTQDAVLKNPDSLKTLVAAFANPKVGAAYGRQLPRAEANAIEAHARLFNYPAVSQINTWESRRILGIKAAFLSNSFSAYRREAIQSVGGFPLSTIMAEDSLVAGKMLMAGWQTAYVAEAEVVHSHDFTVGEEFSRYFDTGVSHNRESWFLRNYGSANQEGRRFVASEMKHLLRHAPQLVPEAMARTVAKWLGYTLGRHEAQLPLSARRRLSMHKHFWDKAI